MFEQQNDQSSSGKISPDESFGLAFGWGQLVSSTLLHTKPMR
jgi:hypothetical protein